MLGHHIPPFVLFHILENVENEPVQVELSGFHSPIDDNIEVCPPMSTKQKPENFVETICTYSFFDFFFISF